MINLRNVIGSDALISSYRDLYYNAEANLRESMRESMVSSLNVIGVSFHVDAGGDAVKAGRAALEVFKRESLPELGSEALNKIMVDAANMATSPHIRFGQALVNCIGIELLTFLPCGVSSELFSISDANRATELLVANLKLQDVGTSPELGSVTDSGSANEFLIEKLKP